MPMAIGCSTHVTHVLQPITGKTQWRATQNLVTWQESTGIRGHVTWCASSNPHVVSCDKFTLLQRIINENYHSIYVTMLGGSTAPLRRRARGRPCPRRSISTPYPSDAFKSGQCVCWWPIFLSISHLRVAVPSHVARDSVRDFPLGTLRQIL
ncbi:hypothetical protein HUJ04_012804 [Dendroctonus ponderosae]|nr:hypothetical protein HUJ04_012804 [Dendroctonus ponderosae]